MLRNSKELILIERVITIVVLSILAAIVIHNYNPLRERANEGNVKANMHTLQRAVEKFAVENNGIYPTDGDQQAVIALMPRGEVPKNPFTGTPCKVYWGNSAQTRGDIGYEIPSPNHYGISGYGADCLLTLRLANDIAVPSGQDY